MQTRKHTRKQPRKPSRTGKSRAAKSRAPRVQDDLELGAPPSRGTSVRLKEGDPPIVKG